ncbi:MAG: hypothetical protein LBG31_04040, partial [Prevotellaceae bacterium]|nr:hypothetical protein [Prevotellaceae bacterium]
MNTKILLVLLLTAPACSPERPHTAFEPSAGKIISPNISNQQVTSFAEDALGHIWIGTGRGANKYDSYDFCQYLFDGNDTLSLC